MYYRNIPLLYMGWWVWSTSTSTIGCKLSTSNAYNKSSKSSSTLLGVVGVTLSCIFLLFIIFLLILIIAKWMYILSKKISSINFGTLLYYIKIIIILIVFICVNIDYVNIHRIWMIFLIKTCISTRHLWLE